MPHKHLQEALVNLTVFPYLLRFGEGRRPVAQAPPISIAIGPTVGEAKRRGYKGSLSKQPQTAPQASTHLGGACAQG